MAYFWLLWLQWLLFLAILLILKNLPKKKIHWKLRRKKTSLTGIFFSPKLSFLYDVCYTLVAFSNCFNSSIYTEWLVYIVNSHRHIFHFFGYTSPLRGNQVRIRMSWLITNLMVSCKSWEHQFNKSTCANESKLCMCL